MNIIGLKKGKNTITQMLGELGTKKEELDQEHQMWNIDYRARNKQKKNSEFFTYTENIRTRTTNEIHNL